MGKQKASLKLLFRTAKNLFEGPMASRDYARGTGLLERLVAQKYPQAMWYYGRLLFNEEKEDVRCVSPDRQRGLMLLHAAADAGFVQASLDLVPYWRKVRALNKNRHGILNVLKAVTDNMPDGWHLLGELLTEYPKMMKQVILGAPAKIGIPFYHKVTQPPYRLKIHQQKKIDKIYGRVAVYQTRKAKIKKAKINKPSPEKETNIKQLPKLDQPEPEKTELALQIHEKSDACLEPDIMIAPEKDEIPPKTVDPIDVELTGDPRKCPDLKLDPVKRTWKYKNHDVCIYIPAYNDQKYGQAISVFEKRHKLHVTECQTIREMRKKRKFIRYAATNNLTGPYQIYVREKEERAQKVDLRVCMNCLKELNVNGAADMSYDQLRPIARAMDFAKFVREYGTSFKKLPDHWIS